MGGVPLEEVSSTPIAFVYWDAESARQRQELIDMSRSGRSSALPTKAGVAKADGIAALFGVDPGAGEGLHRYPGRVALIDPSTGKVTPFQGTPVNARPLAWSEDHNRLMFTSAHLGGSFQIYEYQLDSSELRALTRGPVMHLEGDYAREGDLVMSWIDRSAGRNVAGLSLAGSHGERPEVLVDGVYPTSPRFSPASNDVIYVRAMNRSGRSATSRDASMIVMQALHAGVDPLVLTRGREPVFSPDGSTLVYAAETRQGWRLHRIRVDGGARSLLGRSIREERNPAVSPDGRHVVYVSPGDDGVERLYIRRIDGTGDRLLLTQGGAAWPVW